jgi:hypothetical protein
VLESHTSQIHICRAVSRASDTTYVWCGTVRRTVDGRFGPYEWQLWRARIESRPPS